MNFLSWSNWLQNLMGSEGKKPYSIEHHPRPVIERQLLDCLKDGSKVAILATEDDLLVLMSALKQFKTGRPEWLLTRDELLEGMKLLHKGAFR